MPEIPHPLDARRDDLLAAASRLAGAGDDSAVRDALATLLEDREEVCGRDALRIATAWVRGQATPREWRRK